MLGLIVNYLRAAHAARQLRRQVHALRERRFRGLLQYAFDRSPYYRDLYCAHGLRREDLAEVRITDLPTVAKADIQNNFDRVATSPEVTRHEIDAFLKVSYEPVDLFKGRYHVLHTSGTTGEPAVYCYGPRDWDRGLALQSRLFNGLRIRRKVAVYGVARAHAAGATLAASTQSGPLRALYDTRLFDVADPFDEVLGALNTFQPSALFAYGSLLERLADAQRAEVLSIAPQHVFAGAEPTPRAARDLICNAFPTARCFDFYSAGEAPAMGLGDLRSDRLALMDDFYYFEPDEHGLILTNLFNHTLPLIRYRLGDPVRVVAEEATDGPFQLVESIQARPRGDILVRGRAISSHLFDAMYVAGIRRYQYVIADSDIQVHVVLDDTASLSSIASGIRRYWSPIMQRTGLADVKLEVKRADVLAVDPASGKLPLVVVISRTPELSAVASRLAGRGIPAEAGVTHITEPADSAANTCRETARGRPTGRIDYGGQS